MSSVEWRPVVGASRYEVSNAGGARSVDRVIKSAGRWGDMERRFKGCDLKPCYTSTGGYATVFITYDDGKRRSEKVHVLVCEAFHGPKPSPSDEVRHRNGINTDNRSVNLVWGTRSENSIDTVAHGNNQWANRTHCPQKHLYDEQNTFYEKLPGGKLARRCRRCRADQRKPKRGWCIDEEER